MSETVNAFGLRTVVEAIDDAEVTVTELDFFSAADLAPELMAVIMPAYASIQAVQSGDEGATARAMTTMATALAGGKLTALLPRLLKTVIVVVKNEDGKAVKCDLSRGRDEINKAFAGKRKTLAVKVIKLAFEVSFRDFFTGAGLSAGADPAQ